VPCRYLDQCQGPTGIGLLSLLGLQLSFAQDSPLGDFPLAPACPIEKATLWVGFLYLKSESGYDEGVMQDKVFAPNWEFNHVF